MNIEDKLFPKHGQLKIDKDGCHSVQIIDAELDPIECTFDYSGTIIVNTKDLTYVNFTIENLESMIDLILESEELYEQQYLENKKPFINT